MEQLSIVIGSKNDMEAINTSRAQDILKGIKIPFSISICSGHRNEGRLEEILNQKLEAGVRVFVGVAGAAAILAGLIQAKILYLAMIPPPFVIGVALPSPEFPNALDALLTMTRNPSGVPVAFAGIGKAGLENAVYLAAQVIAQNDGIIARNYRVYMGANRPLVKEDLVVSLEY